VSIGVIHMVVCRIVTSMGLECSYSYMQRSKQSVSTTRRAIDADSPPQCFPSTSSIQPTATAELPFLTDRTGPRPSPYRSHTRRSPSYSHEHSKSLPTHLQQQHAARPPPLPQPYRSYRIGGLSVHRVHRQLIPPSSLALLSLSRGHILDRLRQCS
jgi:hypothetical protein